MEVFCRVCPGVIDRVPTEEAPPIAAEHFRQLHPLVRPGLGQHYTALPATPACDTCLAILELPWWEHVSTPPTPASGQDDHDGRWLLCDACHDLWAHQTLGAWVRRAWTVHLHRSPWLAHLSPAFQLDARAQLATTLRLLIERLDTGHRVTLPPR